MATIKARIAADNEAVAGVMSATVFGHTLTRDFAEIEVSDEVAAKLKGNPCVDVMVRKPKAEANAAPTPLAPSATPAS